MRRTVSTVMAAAMLAGVGIAAGTAPASADTVYLYQNADYTGGQRATGALSRTYHGYYFNNGYRLWDSVTSLKNYVGNYTTFWTGHFCSGTGFSVEPGGVRRNVGVRFNDQFSSHAPEWYLNGC